MGADKHRGIRRQKQKRAKQNQRGDAPQRVAGEAAPKSQEQKTA